MVVQHNMQAMNANRMLGITTKSQSKATEKLSSGYRINRAADDAAGLSISEKMRKQIKGLDQASTNAQDGISSVQTAEGALGEVHAMLQRMNELAVQAANGTNAESDRQSIQNEIEQLTTEIDRVAETTKFNETYLLKGNGKESSIKINAKDAGIEGALTGVGTGLATFKMDELKTGEQITIGSKGYTIGTGIETVRDNVPDTGKVTINGTEYEVVGTDEVDPASKKYTQAEIAGMISDGDKVVIGSNTYVAMVDGTDATTYKSIGEAKEAIAALADADTKTFKVDGTTYTFSATDANGIAAKKEVNMTSTAAKIQVAINAKTPTNGTSTVTIGGTKYKIAANDDNAGNTPPEVTLATAFSTAATAAGGTLAEGTEIVYSAAGDGTDNVTYKIGAEADIVETEVAADTTGNATALNALAVTGAKFEIGGETFTIGEMDPADTAPDGIGDNDASIISADQAYKLIADELLKASSVGCDPGSEAKAVDAAGAELDPGVDAFTIDEENGTVIFNIQEATVVAKQGLQFTLHVGADADESNKIALTIDAMDAAGLGIKNMNVVDNTGAKATYAIDSIADAIAKVSAQRSELGAIQNRLEHTIANLDNVVENTTAAESAIRDTDMAEQMVEYSKNNILMQAGQSMLAQANQSTQGVLSLLQ